MVESHRFFLLLNVSFILGVFISSILYEWGFFFKISSFLFFLLLAYFLDKKIFAVVLLIISFLFGVFRTEYYFDAIDNYPEQNIVEGMVAFTEKDEFYIGNTLVHSNKDIRYGDIIRAKGKTAKPSRFLNSKGVINSIRAEEVRIVARNRGNFLYKIILDLQGRMKSFAKKYFKQEDYAILYALILGDKSELGKGFKDDLSKSGLSHIVAISGLHIVILQSIIFTLLSAVGVKRKYSLISTILFIFFFITLSGFKVSAIRAGVMGSILIISKLFGKLNNSLGNLLLCASVMIAINPTILIYNISFQLSFSAVLGILLFGEYFKRKLKFVPTLNFLSVRGNIATTLSALVLSVPLIVFTFGTVSTVSVFSNLSILPFIGIIVLFSFAAMLTGAFVPLAGFLFSMPLFFLIPYFRFITRLFSSLPFSSFNFDFPIMAMAAYYMVVFYWAFWARKSLDFVP